MPKKYPIFWKTWKPVAVRIVLVILAGLFVALSSEVFQSANNYAASSIDDGLIRNARQAMFDSASVSDPELSSPVVLTHFSHVCQLVENNGDVVYVADRRAVLPDMPMPRGLNYITFFAEDFTYLGKLRYVHSRPLWCDGSKLYLFGNLDVNELPGNGNVIDVSKGFNDLVIYYEEVYGSSY